MNLPVLGGNGAYIRWKISSPISSIRHFCTEHWSQSLQIHLLRLSPSTLGYDLQRQDTKLLQRYRKWNWRKEGRDFLGTTKHCSFAWLRKDLSKLGTWYGHVFEANLPKKDTVHVSSLQHGSLRIHLAKHGSVGLQGQIRSERKSPAWRF